MSRSSVVVFTTAMVACGAAIAVADERRVPSQYPTIASALVAAQPGDTVLVADGVYVGPGNKDLSAAGKAITIRSESGPGACIIECQASPADPHRAFVFQSGETSATVLDGFTIRGGATPDGAVADQFNGGGILCAANASPVIRNCVFTANRAGCWGGAVCASSTASPTLISCTFRNNTSQDEGGGFFSWSSGTPRLINCTFTGNSAPSTGGAVSVFSGQSSFINCTFVGNSSGYGSGVYAYNSTLTNCIVRSNTGDTVQIRGIPTVTYSNVQGGFAGAGNIDADAMFWNMAGGDLGLRPGSPCIDAGSSGAVPAGITTDAAGNPRFHDDSGSVNSGLAGGTGAVVDMGALEFQGTTCPHDWDHNGLIEPADVAAFVNTWFASLTGGTLAGDIDHSGRVDPADIASFIGGWFGGC